jgi:hypothetical protein
VRTIWVIWESLMKGWICKLSHVMLKGWPDDSNFLFNFKINLEIKI